MKTKEGEWKTILNSTVGLRDHLKQFHNVEVSHMAIYKWIGKYVNLMKRYVDRLVLLMFILHP